ncbi:hypothetical protein PVAP13_6NG206703 [Panicum virgatum]|uniref:Uncharacterized protein n=1 Tax=Panicum virgatum TaxID=38727 RepID=A0A8T0QX39_PANVG|nr:hypothetical protein PVAP13_6NG206703 [Panicum virgatum]
MKHDRFNHPPPPRRLVSVPRRRPAIRLGRQPPKPAHHQRPDRQTPSAAASQQALLTLAVAGPASSSSRVPAARRRRLALWRGGVEVAPGARQVYGIQALGQSGTSARRSPHGGSVRHLAPLHCASAVVLCLAQVNGLLEEQRDLYLQ